MLIRSLQSDDEAHACATAMASTDPWLRLGRGFEPLYQGLTDGSREVHVAVESGTLLGVIALNLKGPFPGYIQAICVTEAARGKGVGSELVAFAETRIFREWPNVFLCVSSFNDRARALYERLGYKEVGVLRDYLVRGYDEILMRKCIAPLSEFRPQ